MTERECNVSTDCLATALGAARLCYPEESFSNESFFCDCSVWYGWTGENCDATSGQLLYFRTSLFIQVFWGMFVLVATGRTLLLHYLYGSWLWKSDPVIYTGIFVFFSSFFITLHGLIVLPALFDPSRFQLVTFRLVLLGLEEEETEATDVNVKGGKFASYSLLFGSACFYFSAMTVIFSWFKVIGKLSRFDAKETQQSVEKWTKRFQVFVLVYFMILLVLSLANMLLATSVVIALTSFVLAITYICSTVKFIQTLERFNVADNEKIERTLWMVRTSCILNMVCLTLICILLIAFYATFSDVFLKNKPGDFNVALFCRDLSLAFGMTLATYTSWYVNSMATRETMVPGLSRFSCLWVKWDSQYEKLMTSTQIRN